MKREWHTIDGLDALDGLDGLIETDGLDALDGLDGLVTPDALANKDGLDALEDWRIGVPPPALRATPATCALKGSGGQSA